MVISNGELSVDSVIDPPVCLIMYLTDTGNEIDKASDWMRILSSQSAVAVLPAVVSSFVLTKHIFFRGL